MALYDYQCVQCDEVYENWYQPIGSDPEPRCPRGHPWKRLIVDVRIDKGFTGGASLSPAMQAFWDTGDPNLAFGPGKKDPDVITLEDLGADPV